MPTCPHFTTNHQSQYYTKDCGTDRKKSARYCMRSASMPASRASRHSATWTWPESTRAVVEGQSGDVEDTDQTRQRLQPTVEDDEDSVLQRDNVDNRSELSSLAREPQHRSSSQQADRLPQQRDIGPMSEQSRTPSIATSDTRHLPPFGSARPQEDMIRHSEGPRRQSRRTEPRLDAERPNRRHGRDGRTLTSPSPYRRHGPRHGHRTGRSGHHQRHRRRRSHRPPESQSSPDIEWWELAIAAALGLCILVHRAIRKK